MPRASADSGFSPTDLRLIPNCVLKRKYQDNSEEWRNKKIKAEIKDINRENGEKNSKGEVLDYLVLQPMDSIYKDRIINLFGIDGVEDFRTAVGLRTSSGLDYRY